MWLARGLSLLAPMGLVCAQARPVKPAIKAVAIKVVRIDFMKTSFR
jgi:hypothetical protein